MGSPRRTVEIRLSKRDQGILIAMILDWLGSEVELQDDSPTDRSIRRVLAELRRTR